MLALVYAPGTRPGIAALEALSSQEGLRVPFRISHVGEDPALWAELLASGLTFDCRGLGPGEGMAHPGAGSLLGLHEPPSGEVVTLEPAPHLAEGRGLLPVVRALAGLGAELGRLPGLAGAFWQPARSWMAPKYFCGIIDDWLSGGAFPALGLTALQRTADGGMVSVGLDFLIGQELHFEPNRKLFPAAIARIAVRLIHELVESGALREAAEFIGPEGERLLIEPVRQGRQLRISVQR